MTSGRTQQGLERRRKRLLQHEQGEPAWQVALGGGGKAPSLADLARRYGLTEDTGRLADSDLRARLAAQAMDARAHGLTLARAMAEAKGGDGATNAASVLKNSATAVSQARAELTLEIMGAQGLGWEGEAFAPEEIDAVRGWLSGKAMSIYGGSFEIQNNIIAKRILGLPETTQAGVRRASAAPAHLLVPQHELAEHSCGLEFLETGYARRRSQRSWRRSAEWVYPFDRRFEGATDGPDMPEDEATPAGHEFTSATISSAAPITPHPPI